MIQQMMYLNVEEIEIENREISKIILKKNERKQCRYLEKHKKNRKNKRESLEKKKQFRFGRLVQPQSVGVLALTQSAHSQDLCWADTFSSDLREEPQPKVPKVHKMFTFACIVLLFLFKGKKHKQGHIRNIYIYIYIYI